MTPQNNNEIETFGTWLQGHITASYTDLALTFGLPTTFNDSKIDAQWCLKFDDGTIATIYNYKDGRAYLGQDGTPTVLITDWHIGGHSEAAVAKVKEALGLEVAR